jgi:replicative DNA helicase
MIHFDENAERNVITALCVSNHATQIFRELVASDFFSKREYDQFEWLHKAYQAGTFHEATVRVMDKGLPEPETILPVFDAVKTVRNHAIRRNMETAANNIRALCEDYSNPASDVQAQFKRMAVECMDARACKIPSDTKDDLRQFVDEVSNDTRAFLTGIPGIDRAAAVQPRDFVIMGARPAVGKSALGTGFILANFLGKERFRGIMFCMEMDRKQTYSRLISHMTGIPLSKFLNIRDYPMTAGELGTMQKAIETIDREFPKRWFQQGVSTLDDIRQVVELERPDFILIDYVQIVKHYNKHGNVDRLQEVSVALRQMALEMDIAVVALAQLNRDANGGIPSISQIKGSGQFEQDATHIFLLDRPESERTNKHAKRNYYTKDNRQIDLIIDNGTTNRAALLVSKNRNGPTFYEILNFNPTTTAFTPHE